MYYIEYFRKKPGVSYDHFKEVVSRIYEEWKDILPEDELVLLIGRTWRLGPDFPYMAVYRIKDFSRISYWEKVVEDPVILAKMKEFLDVADIFDAGVYEDFGEEQL
ncbi:MAG: hypothetical protein GTO18_13740 [Anaerolineales bacterium]|nr:hypothetical protein [Anaerolineales bacterium]